MAEYSIPYQRFLCNFDFADETQYLFQSQTQSQTPSSSSTEIKHPHSHIYTHTESSSTNRNTVKDNLDLLNTDNTTVQNTYDCDKFCSKTHLPQISTSDSRNDSGISSLPSNIMSPYSSLKDNTEEEYNSDELNSDAESEMGCVLEDLGNISINQQCTPTVSADNTDLLVGQYFTSSEVNNKLESTKLSSFDKQKLFLPDDNGDTKLHVAIKLQLVPIALKIIQCASSSLQLGETDAHGYSALHLSVITNKPVIVRALCERSASNNARDKTGNTPLHLACQFGYIDCVLELMRYCSTDISCMNYEGLTCLHLAALHRHLVVTFLLLIKGKGDVNLQEGRSGFTILHDAVQRLDIVLIQHLLQLPQLDINRQSYNGSTALDIAFSMSNRDITLLLQHHGAQLSRYSSLDSDSEEIEVDSMDHY